MNENRCWKVAVVGCGVIAEVHAKYLSQMKECELIGFVDIKIERAQNFADQYGGKAYKSIDELLSMESPEVLHICTPHCLHVPMAIKALKCNIHVFVEKPVAINREEWEELKLAAKESKSEIGVCFQNRYNLSIQYVKKLFKEGIPGKILGARGILTWLRNKDYYIESGWRGQLDTEGGGVLINQAIHTLDLLGRFLGKPQWVESSMANHHLKGVIEVEDMMEAYIQYEKGNAVFYATTAYCKDVPPLIELICEKMTIRIEEPEVTCRYNDGRIERFNFESMVPLGKDYWGCGHVYCIQKFYDCLSNGEYFDECLAGVEETANLMLALYESARMGKAYFV